MNIFTSRFFLALYYLAFTIIGFSWVFYLIHLYYSEVTLGSVYTGPLLSLFIDYTLLNIVCVLYVFFASFFMFKKIKLKGWIYICICIVALFLFQYLIATLTSKRLAEKDEIPKIT